MKFLTKNLSLFFLFGSFQLSAQLDNQGFERYQYLLPQQKNQLAFQFNSFNFFKNNEYFGTIADGYTLFGYRLNPQLTYQPASHIKLALGALLWQDFGNDKTTSFVPTFTLKIQQDSVQYLFGTLDGTVNHQLIEPLMNFERVMTHQEQGFQLVKRKNGTFFDLWVDWQRMLYAGQPTKEEIFAGISWVKPLWRNEYWQVSLPVQWTAKHRGGQFSTDTAAVTTAHNAAIGLNISRQFIDNQSFIKKLKLQTYWVGYVEQSSVHRFYKDGAGLYLNLSIDTRWFGTMLSYWNASHFQSPNGGDLYQSVGRVFKKPNTRSPNRNILIVRFNKNIQLIDNLFLTARFEPYYDFGQQLFEHSEGLYLTYRKDFGLGNK